MLPEQFKARMKTLLKEDYEAFAAALEEPPVKGIRVNTLKCPISCFTSETEFEISPISYCEEGFTVKCEAGMGNTPEHHSGQIYMQDPGAMSALSALDIKKGWWVLDLCAAPGGKSSQAAAKIGSEGFLLSNEFVPKRAKICVGNFERLGIKNAMVTSLDTAEFKKYFNAAFDLVIADAPCSGEGMFRKSGEALTEWSEENVRLSAERQKEILENAAPLVKAGGYLLYSTCTFSLEENEMNVDAFLSAHPDYKLTEVRRELRSATADGISFEGAKSNSLGLTRRFYPHISAGEGQFVALMQRSNDINVNNSLLFETSAKEPTKEELRIIERFFKENLKSAPNGKIQKCGENLVLISHGCPVLPKSVFSAGVLLGEVRKSVFHPSHQFFSAYGELFRGRLTLTRADKRLSRYLSGEEIEKDDDTPQGYIAVFYQETPLGGGKCAGDRVKNHYPKGLRIQ